MANLGTLSLGTVVSASSTATTGTPPVLETIASFNDGSYVYDATNSNHTGVAVFTLADMPADFKHMETVSVRLRYMAAAALTNTWNSLTASITKSDGTALTDTVTVVAGPITATTGTNSSVIAFTGVDTSASLADWSGAVVRINWSISRNKGGDSVEKRVTAAEITGTYAIDTSIEINDTVTVTDDVTVKLARLVIETFDVVTLAESVSLAQVTQVTPLFISTSDLVVVQEGQESIPKFNVFDAVAVTESITLNMPLAPTVFDAILTQDSPAVQPIFFSLAISVFDTVLVEEGQVEDNSVKPFALDTITVDDNTVSIAFNLLRINTADVVTVVDAPGVFAQGPIGILVFDNVLAQEFIRPNVSVYINCFDDVSVDDGSRLIEEFDAITVTEDITVALSRLVIDVFDAVALTESVEADGLVVDILEGTTIEDIIVAEDVTVLLTKLRPDTVSDDVTVTDDVTVFVSSISLTVDVSDDVTVLDVVDTIQLNPLLIDEFTEITVTESVDLFTNLLLIDVFDAVTVSEDVTMVLLPILLDVYDEVSVMERVAMRITAAGSTQPSMLPVLGAGK